MNFIDKKDKLLIQPFNPYNYQDTLENKNKEDLLNKYSIALEVGNTNIGNIINIINDIFNPNYKNINGDTSLHILIKVNNKFLNETNKLHILKILINNGADFSIKNNLLQNILHLCFKYKLFNIINYIYTELDNTRIISNIDINNKNYLNYLIEGDQNLLIKNNDFIIKKKSYVYTFNNFKNLNNNLLNNEEFKKLITDYIINFSINKFIIDKYDDNNQIINLKNEIKEIIKNIYNYYKLTLLNDIFNIENIYNIIYDKNININNKTIITKYKENIGTNILKYNINNDIENIYISINDIIYDIIVNKHIYDKFDNKLISIKYILDLYKSYFNYAIEIFNIIILQKIKYIIHNYIKDLKLNDKIYDIIHLNIINNYNYLDIIDDNEEKILMQNFLNKSSEFDKLISLNKINNYIKNIYYDNNYYDLYDLYKISYYEFNNKNITKLISNNNLNLINLINEDIYKSIILCCDNYINYNYILLIISKINKLNNNIIKDNLNNIKDKIFNIIKLKINLYNKDLINIYYNNLISEYENNTSLYNLIPLKIKNFFIKKEINIFKKLLQKKVNIKDDNDINDIYINDIYININKYINNNFKLNNINTNTNTKIINIIYKIIYNNINKLLNKNKNQILFNIIIDLFKNLLKKEKNINYNINDDIKIDMIKKFNLIIKRYILVILNNDYLKNENKINNNNYDDNKNTIKEELKNIFIEFDNNNNDYEEIYEKYISNYIINLYDLLILYIYKYNINEYKLLINIYKSIHLYKNLYNL